MSIDYKIIMEYSSDIFSSIFFVVWLFQLLRSAFYYYKFSTSKKDRFDIAFIHLILLSANVLYLIYEFEVVLEKNPIWLIFSMYFLLNIASIWSFSLITQNTEEGGSTISPGSQKLYKVLIFILVAFYVFCWFFGIWGVKCKSDHYPTGLGVMAAFTFIWSTFVLYQLKN